MSVAVIVFGICALACVVGHVAILVSIVRTRSASGDANMPRPRPIIEIVWALVPALVLAFVLTATWVQVRANATHKPVMMMKVAR
jgi:heme/copper-type cytochrome/quinol oxidase subunit 2